MANNEGQPKRGPDGKFLPGHKPPRSPGRPPGPNGVKARAARLAGEQLEQMLGRATEIISDELAITASTAAPTARNAAAQEPGEALTARQALRDAPRHHRLEQVPQQVAVAETTVAVLGEGRVIRDWHGQIKTAEME